MSWYRSGVLSNIDQGFCPTLAMAFKACEPHFVYKTLCPLHPLELCMFVLSIQSIRLVGSLTILYVCRDLELYSPKNQDY
jgi:hypothetical protein